MVWEGQGREGSVEYEFYSFLPRTKDYYKILEVDYDATLDAIRSNYLRLALKWHPDKQQGQNGATLKFQEINEAYKVLSDPVKRREYDVNGVCDVEDYNLIEYLHRFKGLILTCNGLGMGNAPRCLKKSEVYMFGKWMQLLIGNKWTVHNFLCKIEVCHDMKIFIVLITKQRCCLKELVCVMVVWLEHQIQYESRLLQNRHYTSTLATGLFLGSG